MNIFVSNINYATKSMSCTIYSQNLEMYHLPKSLQTEKLVVPEVSVS